MNQGLTAVINLELDKAKKDVASLQEDIKKLEQQILETRKAKLISADDTKAVATYNKELQGLSIQLKEKRLALRDATTRVKEQTSANREATKAQQQFTQSVSTSASGLQEINSVLAKYPSSVNATSSSLEALKNRLVELRRLRFSDALNPADQRVLAKSIFETTNEIRDQKTALGLLAREAKATEQATKRLGQAQQQFRNQAGASNAVALEFNRIIQDAPFGIIGVGNNIQQLAGNFSALKASAGGTGAALKAAFSSIITPTNLVLLGISAVTSAFTAYQLGAFDSNKETKSLTDELQNFISTLGGVQKATLDSSISIDQEITKFNALVSVLDDTNSSLTQRKNAVDEIQSNYGSYLGNLSEEEILVRGLGLAYNEVISALIAKATVEANQKEIGETIRKNAELISKRASEENKFIDLQIKKNNALATERDIRALITKELSLGATVESVQGLVVAANRYKEIADTAMDAMDILETSIQVANKSIDENDSSLRNLITSYNDATKALLSYSGAQEGGKESTDQFIAGIELSRKNIQGLIEDVNGYIQVLQLIKNQNFEENFAQPIESIERGSQEQEFTRNLQRGTAANTASKETDKLTESVKKLYATEALGGNPFSFLIDSAFKLNELSVQLDNFSGSFEEKMQLIRDQTLLTGNIFSGLGDVFASVFASGNKELGQFISALGDFVGQVFIFAQAAKASKAASDVIVAGKQAEATASGISAAAQTASSMGPASFFTLAPLIASAVGLIGAAFRGLGGSRKGGSANTSAVRSASMNTVGSSISGMGSAFNPFGDMQLRTVIRGSNIELLLERVVQEKRA
jgi:hypothetical protein